MNNNKFKYVFEDDYNFYYADNIVYKYLEYTVANSSNQKEIDSTAELVSIERTNDCIIFNKEKQRAEAVYQVSFIINCSGQKYLTNCTESDLVNKLGFTIVAKREDPEEHKFQGFEKLLDTVKTKNNTGVV